MKEDKHNNHSYPGFVDSFQHPCTSGSVTSFGVAQCKQQICDEPKWKLHRKIKKQQKLFFRFFFFNIWGPLKAQTVDELCL